MSVRKIKLQFVKSLSQQSPEVETAAAAQQQKQDQIENLEINKLLDLCAQPGMTKALNALASQYAEKEEASKTWRDQFRSIDQLEDGGIRFLVNGLFPEGTTFIGALPGAGKTWFGLSIAKALVTGKPLMGRFKVPQRIPVLYMIPESSSRAFKKRLKQLDIPSDPSMFLCRTISEGSVLPLDNPFVLEAVKAMKPVVFLDTAIRFSTATDENAAAQNKKLVDDIISLRAAGAVGVFAFHHATKSSQGKEMTQENTLRGTGDYAAMCDAAYGIQIDQPLYANGRGPLEILVVCTKPRDISPQPKPFTLISTMKGENGELIDVLAQNKDFMIKDEADVAQSQKDTIARIVTNNPEISVEDITKQLNENCQTSLSKATVNRRMQNDDYTKTGPVGPNGKKTWMLGKIQLLGLSNNSGEVVPESPQPERRDKLGRVIKTQEELSF